MYQKYGILNFSGKRPNASIHKLQSELIEYLKEVVPTGYRPSARELQRKFSFNLYYLFSDIKDLYNKAGFQYKPINNQGIKSEKAIRLTELVVEILPKLGLKLVERRSVHQTGVDILTIDNCNLKIGLEIKASSEREFVKPRNIMQLRRFLTSEKLDKVILVTTTDRVCHLAQISDFEIINYSALKLLCSKAQLKQLEYVRYFSIHNETKHKFVMRQKIIDYAKKLNANGEKISHKRINSDLHVEVFTYFDDLVDLYKQANIQVPMKLLGRRRSSIKYQILYDEYMAQILAYIQEEVRKGRYPSGVEISRVFGVSRIWNFVKVSYLYEQLGLLPYHKRKNRSKVTHTMASI